MMRLIKAVGIGLWCNNTGIMNSYGEATQWAVIFQGPAGRAHTPFYYNDCCEIMDRWLSDNYEDDQPGYWGSRVMFDTEAEAMICYLAFR